MAGRKTIPLPASTSSTSDADITSRLRGLMPDWYFVNTPITRMRRHAELLDRLPQEQLILDFLRPAEVQLTELTLCAYDDTEPGLLAKVSGVLTALRVNVQTAFINTVTPPAKRGAPPRPFVLNTLLIAERTRGQDRPLGTRVEARVRQELGEVLLGKRTVRQVFAARRRWQLPPVVIQELSINQCHVSGGPNCEQTRITLRASDQEGLLYRMAQALSQLELNVQSAQLNTVETSVEDIYFVTGRDGHALPEGNLLALSQRLRHILREPLTLA